VYDCLCLANMAKQHASRMHQFEQRMRIQLKERQKVFEAAFVEQMANYRALGRVPGKCSASENSWQSSNLELLVFGLVSSQEFRFLTIALWKIWCFVYAISMSLLLFQDGIAEDMVYLQCFHTWLGIRKSIQPVKTEWWGAGVVICLEQVICMWSSWCHCHPSSLAL